MKDPAVGPTGRTHHNGGSTLAAVRDGHLSIGVGMDEESFELTVLDVVEETPEARSISFEVPPELAERFAYLPGQFLTLAVPSERTGLVARCYSLCSSPVEDEPPTITVKRTTDGYASNWLVDHLRPGDRLWVLPPSGIFTPADLDADLLLLAAGSGITPIMSILRTALRRGSGQVRLVYANRDEGSVIFADALAELARAHPDRLHVEHWLETERGLPTQDQLRDLAAPYDSYDAFVCGPAPFMKAAVAALKELGFPRARRHQEKFVSLGGNPFGDLEGLTAQPGPARVTVRLDRETHELEGWPRDTVLLEFLESRGLKAPFSCRVGECMACAYRLVEGEVRMERNEVLDEDDLEVGIRLGCQSLPVSDHVSVSYD